MLGRCVILGKPFLVRGCHLRAHIDAIEVLVLESAEFELPKIGATACLMLFYQNGERKRSLKRCADAVEWFLLGTRGAFSSVTDSCASKCFRKAALCHIEQEEYAQASDIIRHCPGEEAATHYLSFLVAVKQGKGYVLGCGAIAQPTNFPSDPAPKAGKMTVRIN